MCLVLQDCPFGKIMSLLPKHQTKLTGQWLHPWFAMVAENRLSRFTMIMLGVWLCAADAMVVVTIMPSVSEELAGHAWLSWSVSAFMFGGILACSSSGRLAEIIGLRRASIIAGLVFTLGAMIDALASDMPEFLLGRLLQGVGGGWISGFVMVAIAFIFPQQHVAKVFACTTSVWALATLSGPMLGAYISEISQWRFVFHFFALQGFMFCVAAYFLLRGTHTDKGPGIPWLQLGLLSLAIIAIAAANLASDLIASMPFSLLLATLCMLLAAYLLFYLLYRDKHLPISLLPQNASNLHTIPGNAYLAVFCMVAASMAFTSYGPALLQKNADLSVMQAGYVIGAESLAWTAAALYAARFNSAKKIAYLIRLSASCVLLGSLLLATTIQQACIPLVLTGAIVMGAGFGFSFAHISRYVFTALSEKDLAIGSSAIISVRQIGAAVASAITGIAANFAGWNGLHAGRELAEMSWLPEGFMSTLIFSSVLPFGFVGLWAALRLARYIEKE